MFSLQAINGNEDPKERMVRTYLYVPTIPTCTSKGGLRGSTSNTSNHAIISPR
jgi:hypothetical protein